MFFYMGVLLLIQLLCSLLRVTGSLMTDVKWFTKCWNLELVWRKTPFDLTPYFWREPRSCSSVRAEKFPHQCWTTETTQRVVMNLIGVIQLPFFLWLCAHSSLTRGYMMVHHKRRPRPVLQQRQQLSLQSPFSLTPDSSPPPLPINDVLLL